MSADFSFEFLSADTCPANTAKISAGFAVEATPSNAELWRTGRYHELSGRLADELVCAETAGDRQGLIDAANDLACTYRAHGNLEAAAHFQLLAATCERQAAEQHEGRISATSLGNLACDAMLAGKFPIAESLLWKSLLAELAAGNDAGAAADWANLGLLAGLLGELDEAMERLWEALKLHRRLKDAFHTGLDLWHLAQIFEIERNWSRASKLYQKAAIQFTRVGLFSKAHAAQDRANLNQARDAVLRFDACVN